MGLKGSRAQGLKGSRAQRLKGLKAQRHYKGIRQGRTLVKKRRHE